MKIRNLSLKTIIVPLLLSGLLVSCDARRSAPNEGESSNAYKVVVTVGMLADVVQTIGGDAIEVTSLMGAGVDPHLYKPTLQDTRLLSSADAIFYVGLYLEGKLGATLEAMERRNIPVFATGEALPNDQLLHGNGEHADPHVWMDVDLWRQVAAEVATTLQTLRPEQADAIAERHAAYETKLNALNRYVRGVIASIPEDKRVLITAHDAFGYFGRAYGVEVKGIQGISTESEAGLLHLNGLVDEIVMRKIQAVFVESTVADKNVKALIEGAKQRGHSVKIGGELFSDAMGKPRTYEGTYLGMIDHNATFISRALGGTAPELGMNGTLQEASDD